ncbi:MAG: CHASE2 domain-containing protein [Desulfomonile tiedjei]|nr:CHASE2 domain-containing protein [Desulfomonile tiedjei]
MKKKTTAIGIGFSVLWCIIAAVIVYKVPNLCETLNFRIYDWKLRVAGHAEPNPLIVHVDVDDKAIHKYQKEYGQWPWDRSLSAKVVERLSALGAKTIVFDVLYSTPGRSEQGDQALFQAIKAAGNVVSPTAVKTTYDVTRMLPPYKEDNRGHILYDRAWELRVPDRFHLPRVVELQNRLLPLPGIIRDSRSLGHIKGTPDWDGVYRRLPLLVRIEDRCVPCLSLAALQVYWNLEPSQITLTNKDSVEIQHDGKTVRIPVDSHGAMLVRWGPIWESFENYSVLDILSETPDEARQSRYKNKIVVIGFTATGSTDLGVTPIEASSPLSRIHSHTLNTILRQSFITDVPSFPIPLILSVIVTIAFSVVAMRFRLQIGAVTFLAILVLGFAAVFLAFSQGAYEVGTGEWLIVFLPPAVVCLAIRGGSIELRAARVSRTMERYIDRDVLDKILLSGAKLDITAKRTELTVVFVDIQGFSKVSETMSVEYVHRFLNDFFQRMTRIVFDHHGTVDKFLGDGLLAFFGDPIPLENHAESAVRAALDMQREMAELNAEWSVAGISETKGGLLVRIGIKTGVVIVGNLGSARRVEYTVVGSTVNIASRLQSIAPPGGIILCARTRAMIRGNIDCDGPDLVRVKGIDRDIEVYRIYSEAIQATKI